MQFRILGPVEVRVGRHLAHIGRRRERCLLGLLLLEPGRTVAVPRLAELLWDADPPENARAVLHTYASRLRSALGDTTHTVLVSGGGGGYRIAAAAEAVDACEFQRLVAHAGTVDDLTERVLVLRSALALWRGPALGDCASDALRARVCAHLNELRGHTREACYDAELALGRHRELIGELADLVAQSPLEERLAGQLMLARYRCGHRHDALQTFHAVRRRLRDDVGVDPGHELQELFQRLLRGDPDLKLAAADRRGPQPIPVPHQLPPAPVVFAGRDTELATLAKLLTDAPRTSPAVVACHGPGGVGKSALALRAAHAVADHFPDGQMYVDLLAATTGQAPPKPVEVLGRFLRGLGVPGDRVPTDPYEAAALWRSMLVGRRILVVADNAATAAQVRPLIPGSADSACLVTSRRMLASLDCATHLAIDVLPTAAALDLLAQLCGPARVDAEPDQARELVALCGSLPLALRIAGARLADQPGWPIRALVAELADRRGRLDELATGDLAVRAIFEPVYRAIQERAPTAARMFRLLGVLPTAAVSLPVAAALLDASEEVSRNAMTQLADSHLVELELPHRYRIHDLPHLFAAERAELDEPVEERSAAFRRVVGCLLSTVRVAADLVRRLPRPDTPARLDPAANARPIELVDRDAALTWLESERTNLVTIATQAATWPSPTCAYPIHLARELAWFLAMRGHQHDAKLLSELAAEVAERTGDRRAAAHALARLAYAQLGDGQTDQALNLAQRSVRLSSALGEGLEEAYSLSFLAAVHRRRGELERACAALRRAAQLRRDAADVGGQGAAMHNLAGVLIQANRLDEALATLRMCLTIRRQVGDHVGETLTMARIGWLHVIRGDYRQAIAELTRALDLSRETGHRDEECRILISLTEATLGTSDTDAAARYGEAAVRLAQEAGNHYAHAVVLRQLARVERMRGRVAQADRRLRRARRILDEHHPPPDPDLALVSDR